MTARLLALCLLAYPRAVRRRDGAVLLDLALEMAASGSATRQGAALVVGGVRARVVRPGRGRWLLVAGVVAAAALAVAVVGGALEHDVEVEVRACAGCGPVG